MFPISPLGIFALLTSAPILAGAVAALLGPRWSALALAAAAAIFFGTHIGLMVGETSDARRVTRLAAIFLAAGSLGALWGWLLRIARRRWPIATIPILALAALPAILISTAALERQFVPNACLEGLTIDMGDAHYRILPRDAAELTWHTETAADGHQSYTTRQPRKDSLAQLCRMSANRTKALAPDRLAISTPCAPDATCPPTTFHLARTDPESPAPSPWFGDKIRTDLRWSGTNEEGWICFLPNGALTWMSCQTWITPAPGHRASAFGRYEADDTPDTAAKQLRSRLTDWLAEIAGD